MSNPTPPNPAPILAVDTALSACSVAILTETRTITRFQPMQRGHAEALMPMLQAAMEEAGLAYPDIGRFAVTVGPGTFTGVRVGVAAIRGLAVATGRPAIGVTTLQAFAETARGGTGGPVLVALDARREEVYAQSFLGRAPLSEARAIAIPDLLDGLEARVGVVCGSAAQAVQALAAARGQTLTVLDMPAAPDPVAIAELARDCPADTRPEPLYLRPADAKPQAGKRIARR